MSTRRWSLRLCGGAWHGWARHYPTLTTAFVACHRVSFAIAQGDSPDSVLAGYPRREVN